MVALAGCDVRLHMNGSSCVDPGATALAARGLHPATVPMYSPPMSNLVPSFAPLSNLPTTALHREIARRQQKAQRIARKRDRLLAAAAKLDEQIAALGGTGNGAGNGRGRSRRGGRPPRSGPPLAAVLAKVMGSKTMTVGEAGEAAVKAGYTSSASPRAFRVMVNAALINSGKFKRVGRGQYAAK
jgi:hypothetical protein